MRTLGVFDGVNGTISIIEDKATGARRYYEGNAFQSHALPTGTSCFTYVHLMDGLLREASNILLLGCAGGTLATMLHRQGKTVTVVDRNPQSFALARDYFWMPKEIRCQTADFRDFVAQTPDRFDGIGIDVGGPGFSPEAVFDGPALLALRRVLARNGRMAMNILVEDGMDPFTAGLACSLAGPDLNAWIIEEANESERNAIIACAPEDRLRLEPRSMPAAIARDVSSWFVRRPQPGAAKSFPRAPLGLFGRSV
ncbi:spermidine synthase [Labrys monachus]|uniref:SAM-dependent methyltransferase n=1 Tax=Labrys monachus TaxID=217067 RepID=A0ABU0FA17_9HYPH|nr:class I SAM-dependent methyltransferase [Labrys monachus]MDQ0390974.1 SAM-dependent methyltransferase [Labrys monachus]